MEVLVQGMGGNACDPTEQKCSAQNGLCPVCQLFGAEGQKRRFRLDEVHRQVKLSVLASVFPQPIQYQSRKRNLQRFLVLPQLNVKLLWFPLIKYWIRQTQTGRGLNRDQRRHLKQHQHQKYGYWIIAIDQTQWKRRNVFMVSLLWGTHALPPVLGRADSLKEGK